ncbi:hypothetical protein OIU78_003481 [Salix suchowensis]|nr:hypothetical protein OIU78_003481 [Salix suchowensis]
MAATASGSSRRTSSGPALRSVSPPDRFHQHITRSPTSYASSTAFASSSSSFTSRPSTFFSRSASPTRVNMYGHTSQSSSSSVRLNAISPNRSISTVNPSRNHHQQVVRKTKHS